MRKIVCTLAMVALSTRLLLAGGAVSFNWANDGVLAGTASPLFLDAAGTTRLSAGDANTASDGFRLELVAVQGGTNYVLSVASVGDNPSAVSASGEPVNGTFEVTSSVASNVVAGAVGSPLGVRFYNATTVGSSTKYGVVSNASLTVPSPDWVTPPLPVSFAPDATDGSYQGPRSAGNGGFYTDTESGGIFTNHAPVANCRDVTVSAAANCQASVSASQVDNGSTDADGDVLSLSIDPVGPFGLGTNAVTLTVADTHGGTNSCSANVIVRDITQPSISCPASITVSIPADQNAASVTFSAPVVSDSCGIQSLTASPPSGSSFLRGTTPVLCTAVDNNGLSNTCSFTVTVTTPAGTNANDHIVSLQSNVTSLRQCLGEAGLMLLAHDRAGAVAHLATCITAGGVLLSNAQAQATSTALGAKTASKLAKKIASWIAKLGVPLADDDAKALKALLKLTSTGIKVEQMFQKIPSVFPYVVLSEVKGKTGYHGTNEVVCYHVNVFDGGTLDCSPIIVNIANFSVSDGLNVVLGPTIITNVDFCLTTGPDLGGATITATGCDQSNTIVIINTGD